MHQAENHRNASSATVSLLVAASENHVIGKDNQLPWHLPNDLKYFKNLTWGMPIVMGRKTFESIGKPLPGRKSIVVTRNKDWSFPGVAVAHTIKDAVDQSESFGANEVFVIGGAHVFEAAFPLATRLYLTRIHQHFNGDVFLPPINEKEWKLVKSHDHAPDEKNRYPHTYEVWERKLKVKSQN